MEITNDKIVAKDNKKITGVGEEEFFWDNNHNRYLGSLITYLSEKHLQDGVKYKKEDLIILAEKPFIEIERLMIELKKKSPDSIAARQFCFFNKTPEEELTLIQKNVYSRVIQMFN